MSNLVERKQTVKSLFAQEKVKERFNEILGKKSSGFIASVLQTVNDPKFSKVEPSSILNAAAISASLDLVINNSIGLAYIVPYGGEAQFQIGYKGYIQLALRSGQYEALNVIEVYENQYKSFNALTEELDANFDVDGEGKVVGYCAYMKLLNGFRKTVYWSAEKVTEHAKKFSKTFKYDSSVWKKDFDAMAKKTVIKSMLGKYGILSIEMQTAVTTDQSVIKDSETLDVEYVDVTSPKGESKLGSGLDAAMQEEDAEVVEEGQTSILDETSKTK